MTVSRAEIDRMVNQLMHRGPDANAIWLGGNVALGHTRLLVIDLSKAANQPMSNEDGSIWITYSDQILKRKKRGFDVPVGRWLKGKLKELCEDVFKSKGLVTELLQKNQAGENV